MRELYAAVDRLSRALLSDDLSEISDLLATEADADAYDENVWPDTTIISVPSTFVICTYLLCLFNLFGL